MQFVTRQSVESWLENINTLATTGRGWSPDFWKPFHFATLAAQARRLGVTLTIDNEQLDYAIRMGIFEAIGQEPPRLVGQRAPDGRFVEAKAVTEPRDVDTVSEAVTQMFRCYSPENEEALSVLFSELLGNCVAHSSDSQQLPFGLICGQSWPNGNKAQFCVADTGIGIRDSLIVNDQLAERLAEQNACQLATVYGVTGKPEENHSGYGLALTNGLITQNDGNLFVVSGNELYWNRGGRISTSELKHGWDGTFILFEWHLNTSMDLREVYDSWPAPDSMEEDDYNELFN